MHFKVYTISMFGDKGRVLAIDYGSKRVGLAVTDPMQIIVSGLETIPTTLLKEWLNDYLTSEKVVKVVFGKPSHRDGSPTYLWNQILTEKAALENKFPQLEIDFQDESYSSFEARSLLYQSGMKKKKRQEKGQVDRMSAVVILRRHLGHE